MSDNAEKLRLTEADNHTKSWKKWGPYLAERQWGTVREDYSENGDAWGYVTHDNARSKAYRWGEDGSTGKTSITVIFSRAVSWGWTISAFSIVVPKSQVAAG